MTLDTLPVWLEAAPKAIVYLSLVLAIGTCAVRWFVLPRAGLAASVRDLAERRLARVLLTAYSATVLGLVVRLLSHTFAAFGDEWRSVESLRVIALESRWGSGWQLQAACAAAALLSAFLIPKHPQIGWPTATLAAIAGGLAAPLLGHAAGSATRMAFHGLHILGGGVWLGALAAIVVVGPRAALLVRFTPLALAGATIVVLAGLVMAVEYVAAVSNLWSTTYGRVLALKLAIFAGVLACGYLNWRTWGHSRGDSIPEESGRLAVVESCCAAAILIVTSLLTELEHP